MIQMRLVLAMWGNDFIEPLIETKSHVEHDSSGLNERSASYVAVYPNFAFWSGVVTVDAKA
jgi:hypothetical protein